MATIVYDTKRENEAHALRQLRVIRAPESHSDHAQGEFVIADCAPIVLDLVLSGWYDERADGKHLPKPDDTSEYASKAFNEWIHLSAMRRVLLAHAARIAELWVPRTWLKGSSAGWRAIGIRNKNEKTETHFHCLFCEDDLATLGNTGRQIATPLMRKLTNHACACAMRKLIDNIEQDEAFAIGGQVWESYIARKQSEGKS